MLGKIGGNSPAWRGRIAFVRIAGGGATVGQCAKPNLSAKGNKFASSSSVQRDMAASVMAAPAPGAMPANSCGTILAIASFQRRRRRSRFS